MNKEDAFGALQEKAQQLRSAAALTVDRGAVAQAVAFTGDQLLEILAECISQGQKISRITSSIHPYLHHLQIVEIHLEPENDPVALGSTRARAVVDISRGKIEQIEYPVSSDFVDPPREVQREGALPFALTIPSSALQAVTPSDALLPQQSVENAFMQSIGFEAAAPFASRTTSPIQSVINTPYQTPFGTTGYSGNPPTPDRTQTDYNNDNRQDVITDNPVDRIDD